MKQERKRFGNRPRNSRGSPKEYGGDNTDTNDLLYCDEVNRKMVWNQRKLAKWGTPQDLFNDHWNKMLYNAI